MSKPALTPGAVEKQSTIIQKKTRKRKINSGKNENHQKDLALPATRILKVKDGKLTLVLNTATRKKTPSPSLESTPDTQQKGIKEDQPTEPLKKRRKSLYTVSPPAFRPLNSNLPTSILWLRLSVRDFVIRFEKIVTIPLKHYQALNNVVGEWDDRLYKSIVLMLFKIIHYDSVQVVPYNLQRDYKRAIEKTQNNLAKVFALLDEFLYQAGFSDGLVTPDDEQKILEKVDSTSAELEGYNKRTPEQKKPANFKDDQDNNFSFANSHENTTSNDDQNQYTSAPIITCPEKSFNDTELDREYRHLYLLNSLIVLASQTKTVRESVTSYSDVLKTVAKTYTNEMTKIDAWFDKQLQKIRDLRKELSRPGAPPGPRPGTIGYNRNSLDPPKTKKVQFQELTEKEALLRQTRQNKIRKAKETQFFNTRRFIPKTTPLGMDYFGNTYWHFQQKSKDVKEVGFWIIVEKSRSVPLSFGFANFMPKTLTSISSSIQNGEAASAFGGSIIKDQKEGSNADNNENCATKSSNPKLRKASGADERHSDEIYGNAQGPLFYMKITHRHVQNLVDWLSYQQQVSRNPSSRTRKLLAKDSSANVSFESLKVYILSLMFFADEEDDEEAEETEEEKEDSSHDKEQEVSMQKDNSDQDQINSGLEDFKANPDVDQNTSLAENKHDDNGIVVQMKRTEDENDVLLDSGSELSDVDSDFEDNIIEIL